MCMEKRALRRWAGRRTGDLLWPPGPARRALRFAAALAAAMILAGAAVAADAVPGDPLVHRTQELLIRFGLLDGAASGALDEPTRVAIGLYQQSLGIPEDGTPSAELLERMEFTERTVALRERLEAARAGQIDAARVALLANPKTRQLIAGRPEAEAADAARDVSACLAAPTVLCLLAEASESAKAVYENRKRDWVLREIVGTQARAGMPADAFETAGRIYDARQIVVALRDIVISRADAGDLAQAASASELIPGAEARAQALTAVAKAAFRAADSETLSWSLAEIGRVAADLPATAAVELLAELAAALGSAGFDGAGRVLDAALLRIDTLAGAERDRAMGAVAAAAARGGRIARARDMLEAVQEPGNRRAVLIALASAYGSAGDVEQGLDFAGQIEEPQYRAVSLADLAGKAGAANGAATGILERALADAMAVDRVYGYARSNALAAVARAQANTGRSEDALTTARTISDDRLRAEAMWVIALALAGAADGEGAEAARQLFLADADGFASDLDRVWLLCNAALLAAQSGQDRLSGETFSEAVQVSAGIGDAWGRSRAFARTAAAKSALPEFALTP